MAISMYFGLPGAGKTTLMTALAIKAVRSKRYQNVYCNVKIKVPGVTYITNECIGKYDLNHGLILVDEALLFANSRNWKQFQESLLAFIVEHRHFFVDVFFFAQRADGLDKNIRSITDRVYYLYKPFILGKWFTKYYRIPYGIIIPDPKKSDSEKLGEIVQGYCKPNFLVRLLSPTLFRPLYYKYFDSWERYYLPPLPPAFKPYQKPIKKK